MESDCAYMAVSSQNIIQVHQDCLVCLNLIAFSMAWQSLLTVMIKAPLEDVPYIRDLGIGSKIRRSTGWVCFKSSNITERHYERNTT